MDNNNTEPPVYLAYSTPQQREQGLIALRNCLVRDGYINKSDIKAGDIICWQYIYYPFPKYNKDTSPKVVFRKENPITLLTWNYGIHQPIAKWRIKSLK